MQSSRANAGVPVPFSIHSCPHGCSVISLGQTTLHLSKSDFLDLVRLLLQHADGEGISVDEAVAPAAEQALYH